MKTTLNQIKLYYYIIIYLRELISKYIKNTSKNIQEELTISNIKLNIIESSLLEAEDDLKPLMEQIPNEELEEIYNILKQNDIISNLREQIEERLFQDMTGLFPQDMDTTIRVHTRIEVYKDILNCIDKLLKENS